MDRENLLEKIDALYRARQIGDSEAIARLVAPGGSFELTGEKRLIETFEAAGPLSLTEAAAWLHANIDLREIERIEAVVEGNRAAVRSNAVFSFGGRKPVSMTLFDLIEFGPDGRITNFRQFADTALVMTEMAALKTPAAAG
jgi:ketosteroid isomerase-like protein